MNTQNNPIKQTSVLSAVGVKSGAMVLKLIALSLLGINGAYAKEALFSGTSSVVSDTQLQSSPEIKRSRVVTLNPKSIALDEHSPSTPKHKQIELNLFDGVSYTATINEVEYRSAGNYTSYGKVNGLESSDVILTVVDGVMTANIITPERKIHVSSAENGQYIVSEFDQTKFPNESVEPFPESISRVENTANSLITPAATTPTDDGSVIDVLVLYTTAAKQGAASGKGIISEINGYIAEANKAYQNSGIKHRLRLVGTLEENYTEIDVNRALYDLTFSATDGFPAMDDVFKKRVDTAADMVVLITQTSDSDKVNLCGNSWPLDNLTDTTNTDRAYSVVPRTCAAGNYSFAHVIGRNLGAKPDCLSSNPPPPNTPYIHSHGHVNANPAVLKRTIMSYNTSCLSCTRIPYFSNLTTKYSDGTRMGTDTGTCQANVKGTFDGTSSTASTAYYVSRYNAGFCDLTGYVERTNVYPAATPSNLYLRASSLNNSYLQFNTADAKLTDASVKALTHRTLVTVRGNKSCLPGSLPYNYGGLPSYLVVAP